MKKLEFFDEDDPNIWVMSFLAHETTVDVQGGGELNKKDVRRLLRFLTKWLESD